MKLFYSVYEEPSFIERQRGQQLGACITEGEDRAKTIEAAADYYCNRMIEDGEYGDGSRDAILVIYNEDTDKEEVENITLEWSAEDDGYDGGRFDYYSSRGVK